MDTKLCKSCGCEKPYFPEEKKNSKASGFFNGDCWDCYLCGVKRRRATPDGRLAANAASAKYLATPENRVMHNATSARRHQLARASYLFKHAPSKAANPKQPQASRNWYAALLRATPKWLTDAQWAEMNAIYASRKKGESGDHIVPLIGKDLEGNHVVCGLNVPWNLQIIPMGANARKGRYFYQV